MELHLTAANPLQELQVATPCAEDWNRMAGDGQVRFCAHCQQNVYNLSAMTGEQAAALLREKEGSLCVRLYRRLDGTVVTADCASLRLCPWRSLMAAAVSVLAVVMPGLLGCSDVQGKPTWPMRKGATIEQAPEAKVQHGPMPPSN